MALSIFANYSMEEVAEASTGPLLLQLYPFRDRGLTESLVRRAESAGFAGLLISVDQLGARPLEGPSWQRDHGGSREQTYVRSHNVAAERLYKNFVGIGLPYEPSRANMLRNIDSGFTWSDLEWLNSLTSLPLAVKGIQTAEDATLCVQTGVAGLIVSNHGGHTVEGTKGTIQMLPEVVDAVGGRIEVFQDGGIRRGTDVIRAMALGAKAVFIGRPVFWGLSVDGETGVQSILEIIRDELFSTMGLMGVPDVTQIDRSLVEVPNSWGRGDDVVERLERLAGLLEKGYLTREEFDAQKAKLLAG